MAAAFDSSSRSWWSMARSQSGPVTGYSPEKPKSKSKSKTLNTLFGLKSKKNPAVAIQDPPLPIQPVPPEHIPQSFANRPPSKSVSSVISRADSFGPRTPSDFQPLDRNPGRQSLLTLSDVDPFASSRSIGTVSSPYQPTDPTRLSAYSNTSSNDHIHRKNVDLASQQRTSYASSSSQSQNHVNGPESPLPLSPPPALHPVGSAKGKLLNKRSDTALNGSRRTENSGQPSPFPNSGASTSRASSNSSSRPPLRPRGLTDNGSTQQAGFFVDRRPNIASVKPVDPPQPSPNASSSSSSRPHPRVVIRQASLQHLSSPAPPPTQRLPPPPQSLQDDRAVAWPKPQAHRPHTAESIPSPISFASAASLQDSFPSPILASPPTRTRRISDRSTPNPTTADADRERLAERSKPSLTPLSPPMTLKKAISHQSLLKRGPLFSSSSSASNGPTPSSSQEPEKTSHKYLKFPHPRIPVPPIPLKHSNSSASTLNDAQTPSEKRASSSSGRKRLFSGSSLRRPSTSHSGTGVDEDNQSVFSMKSDQDLYINTSLFKPWISTQPSHPSFWDEGTPDTVPNSPVHGLVDLGSMSPTLGRSELIKEAPPIMFTSPTLTPGSRQRGFSIRSSSTVASIDCDTDSVLSGFSPRSQKSDHSRFHRSNTITSARGTSNKLDSFVTASPVSTRPRTASSGTPSRKVPERPSTGQPLNQPKFSDLALEQSFFKSSSSPPPVMTSLPPPPRPKTRPTIITQRETSPAKPTVITLSAPPVKRPKPKMSFEKAIHRRSLLRKPSFLEIDDDDDDEDGNLIENGRDDVVRLFDEPKGRDQWDTDSSMGPPVSASFLDFARESFDTVRSD